MNIINAATKTAKKIRAYAIKLTDERVESALTIASYYGSFLQQNHIGIFADIEFEKHFSQCLLFLTEGLTKNPEFEVLHLMTAALAYGGHTRVVERLLEGGFGNGLATLDKLPEPVLKKVTGLDILLYNNIRQRSGIATIKKILEIGCKFDYVVLHIHQNDIYSAIAASLLARLGVKIYFYNHADHCFSFGYFATEKVLEISKYGWIRGALRGIEDKQTFVGIPTPVWKCRETEHDNMTQSRGLFAGSSGKFFPWGDYSAPLFINQFYHDKKNLDNVRLFICGPTGQEKYWHTLNKNVLDKVIFLGMVSHADYLNLLNSSDFYVDSFPIGNGTGFVESVMLGIPSFGLDLLAGNSPADVLKSHSVAELIYDLRSYLDHEKDSYYKIQEIRSAIIRDQSVEACIARIKHLMAGGKSVPLLPHLNNMQCVDNFFEKYWEDNGRILLDISMLSNITFSEKFGLLRCWCDTWPYFSTFAIIKGILMRWAMAAKHS